MDKIAIIGLGYVGLPLAVEFGKIIDVIGFDINGRRIKELKTLIDKTREVDPSELSRAKKLSFSSHSEDLKAANYFIITVPTPIDDAKKPDLRPLQSASTTVGLALKKGDIVIYESTVYPGCTEEICVPILERESGLKFNLDFFICVKFESWTSPKQRNVSNQRLVCSRSRSCFSILLSFLSSMNKYAINPARISKIMATTT